MGAGQGWVLKVSLAAAVLLLPLRAGAQTCVSEGQAATSCRFVLSQPRAFTVEAGADYAGPPAPGRAGVSLRVDGRPCVGEQLKLRRRVIARCQVRLPAAVHLVQATADGVGGPQGVGVRLLPNPRLAALPRETGDLYPRPARRRRLFGLLP